MAIFGALYHFTIVNSTMLSFQLIQTALPGHWHRTDGVLSMYLFAPVISKIMEKLVEEEPEETLSSELREEQRRRKRKKLRH